MEIKKKKKKNSTLQKQKHCLISEQYCLHTSVTHCCHFRMKTKIHAPKEYPSSLKCCVKTTQQDLSAHICTQVVFTLDIHVAVVIWNRSKVLPKGVQCISLGTLVGMWVQQLCCSCLFSFTCRVTRWFLSLLLQVTTSHISSEVSAVALVRKKNPVFPWQSALLQISTLCLGLLPPSHTHTKVRKKERKKCKYLESL